MSWSTWAAKLFSATLVALREYPDQDLRERYADMEPEVPTVRYMSVEDLLSPTHTSNPRNKLIAQVFFER